MAEALTLARSPLALRRQALAEKVAWSPERGVYILRFPRRRAPIGTAAAGVAGMRARYQALFDHGSAPLRWAPTRLERLAIRAWRALCR